MGNKPKGMLNSNENIDIEQVAEVNYLKKLNEKNSSLCRTIDDNGLFNEGRNRGIDCNVKINRGRSLSINTNPLNREEMQLAIRVSNVIQEGKGSFSSKYEIVHKLAHGATSTVYVANNTCTKHQVSIKLTSKNQRYQIDHLEFKNEINMLKKLVHPNIVRIFDYYETSASILMITEICKHGELFSKIAKLTELELSMIMYQIFSALSYCHENKVVHRDLKLSNILISDIEKIEEYSCECHWIKLIDFATAKSLSRDKNEKATIGTNYYIAPEVLNKNYNEKCDLWSAGVILYILLVGCVPFNGKSYPEIFSKIKSGNFPNKEEKYINSTPECQNLISNLLQLDINKRPSAKDALKHPWFTKMRTKEIMFNLETNKSQALIKLLMNYNVQSKIQQMIIAFLAHNSNEIEEMRDILKLFWSFDTEERGKLNKKNLFDGLIIQGINKEIVKDHIDELFLMLDSDNDGYIEFEEFLRGTLNKKTLLNEEMLKFGFMFLDTNNTNIININSIKRCFLSINPKMSSSLGRKMLSEINSEDNEIFNDDYIQFIKKMIY